MLIEWKSEKRRNPFAPQWNIPFWYEKIFEEDECKDIVQSVLRREKEIIEQFRDVTNDGGTGLGPQSLTAKFSQFSVWEWDEPWVNKIRDRVNIASARLGAYMEEEGEWEFVPCITCQEEKTYNHRECILYSQSWANVMRVGEQIHPHWHSSYRDSFLGGHVCISANETSTYYGNPYNKQLVKAFPNEVGYLTMFPNHLVHWTDVHNHSKERISIAMDVLTEQGWEDHPDQNIKPNYKLIS